MKTPSKPPSHSAIWAAATQLFSEKGFAATSVRDIGALAGVDPSLVIRHFGSKEQLFIDTMQLDHNPLLEGPIETLGERFIDEMLSADDQVRSVFIALMRASDSGEIGSQLRAAHENSFVEPIKGRLEGDDAELRARLAAALVGGLLYSLWVVGDEILAATDHRDIVRRYGALLQALITP
ncbi:TetR/AcrR family transcriptional regulator [Glaciihabitans arcticus]|uniref:TetR/AcrR family transcriptional regulator n=1 Tax=Glaciihabitans arcticus TaxID=2668039 RepID=A0A4Q9GSJ6_9MICO|nr:TetR family transcriptional regulator [Glaciihabitans arcticus]TBN57565.1 TetR/AcrR family transcriptional regulator [Glaciihabitans arcticus]